MCENGNFSFLEDDKKPQYVAKNDDEYIRGILSGPDQGTDAILPAGDASFEEIIAKAVARMENTVNYDDILNVAAYFGAEIEPLSIQMQLTATDMN